MIKIIYACNDKYMDGLYLSVLSILRRTKAKIGFYILTADYSEYDQTYMPLSVKNTQILDRLVKTFNKENFIKRIDCTEIAKKLLTPKKNKHTKKFSPYTNLRLLAGQYKEFGDKVIYLDSDIMANGDIEELWNINIGDAEIGVCHNWWARHVLKKDSFNAGVIVFNLKKVHETKCLETAIGWFNKKHFIWADQTVLYLSVKDKIFFPNEFRFNYQKNTIQPDTVLKHFCACPYHWPKHYNVKQWQVDDVHKYLKIYVFDEDFEIWNKAKWEWK